MGKKQINLGLFTSVYSYFLYLLLKGYNENDIIIVHNTFPEEISKNIIEKLDAYEYKDIPSLNEVCWDSFFIESIHEDLLFHKQILSILI